MKPTRSVTPKFDVHRIFTHVALATPACRTLCIVGWADQGTTGHEIHAVVAVQITVVSEYSRVSNGQSAPRSIDASALESSGWHLDWTGPSTDAIVASEETGELIEASRCFDSTNVAHRIVAATWPPEEDVKKLAPIVAQVERAAMAKATAYGFGMPPLTVAS